MKKSMILLGMLSIGYAYAQEGNVGINTSEPKATLDIVPETSNLAKNTNEGIIAPRLTKARIAGIADANLVEGTLVYATDNTYTGANAKVSKITEKGYYFYNGTEWVKVQYKDTDTNDAEWVYDDATKRINLKRSGQSAGFTAKVFFDNEKGRYINVDTENVMREASINGADITSNILTEGSSFNVSHLKADKINYNYTKNPSYFYASKDESFLQVNNEAIKKPGLHQQGHFSNLNTYVYTDQNTTENFGSLLGGTFRAIHRGTGLVQNGIFGSSSLGIIKNGSANNVYGNAANTTIHTAGQVFNIAALASNNNLGRDNIVLNVTDAHSILANNTVYSAGTISNLYGVYAKSTFVATKGATVDNLMGIGYDGLTELNTPNFTINNHYGLRINNVLKGKTSNYAIHTGLGLVRLGDRTLIRTDVQAPNVSLTVHEGAAFGFIADTYKRTLFTGATGGNYPIGTFIGFGAYMDNTNSKVMAAPENVANGKYRFFIHNRSVDGKVYFSPFVMTDGQTQEEFNPVNESVLTIAHEGKKVGIGTNSPTNKLHIVADADPLKLGGLQAGTGEVLVVDANGVVKKGSAVSTTATNGLQNTVDMPCNEDNRGKMNFVKGSNGKSDVFGICMKNKDGNYYWGYMVGGNNPTNGTGAFGNGL